MHPQRWGDPAAAAALPEGARALVEAVFGPVVAAEPVLGEVPAPRLPPDVLTALTAAVGDAHVLLDDDVRRLRTRGKSTPDLLRARAGDLTDAPDAVVRPASHDEVAAVLAVAVAHHVAVVPFGGGTCVTGGPAARRDGYAGLVSLDLARLDRLVEVDPVSMTATFEPGVRGPEAEALLADPGLTLGHFPQSFEYSTVGGWVATRSAGQASTGYGRIDELVEGVRLVAPAGELASRAVPASAAGPDLRELIVGSEGVLGVICEATLRVRRAPDAHRYEGWSFRTFTEGREALRQLAQADAHPDVVRLSDPQETRLSLALTATGSLPERLGVRYLRLRGHEHGCLAIMGFEGDADEVERRRLLAAQHLRAGGGLALGRTPGEAWHRTRYAGPYMRDALLDRRVLVDTLETASNWSDLEALYEAVAGALHTALAERGTPPVVMCHVSHLYRSGASLYFTFLARQEDDAIAQWRAAKDAAGEAIMANGGTITHHHAIGRDHTRWMPAEVGEMGLAVIRAAKDRLDPAGIMNPGKLLPS